ncbi:MAG: AmmeMemoRadiSam system radical SAM enzyme, partial [Pirellulales bacterium]|nr:AmmeMemoRadiSam system radical SAM enzyme [Pirellulales bacterium]
RAVDLRTVAVTAGYITSDARAEFFAGMDAANIDLKAFTEEFYFGLTGAHLDPVLETIRYACCETPCWVELTNLVIPQANDHQDELRRMCDWVLETVGEDVPVHFTAFHPDFRMTDRPRTSHQTLIAAYDLARAAGLRYVYVGNVHDVQRQSTYCPSCGQLLIQRDWHELGHYGLEGNRCQNCQFEVAGHFETQPGSWGRRRQPIRISQPTSHPQHEESPMQTTAQQENLEFNQQERTLIRQAACRVVTEAASGRQPGSVDDLLGELATRPIAGIYVTLKRSDTLRGCCGLQGPPVDLGAAIVDAATRSAREDPRMPPVAPIELPHLTLSVSILGSPRPIAAQGDERIEAVRVGQHGLRIRLGNNAGLLLPVVATERGWNSRQFLDAVCQKAGLPPASWRRDDAVLQIFDGVEFGGPFLAAPDQSVHESALIDGQQLEQLRSWTHNNLMAISSGATPFYYANGVEDGTVSGVIVQIVFDSARPPLSWMQLTMRDGVPLQATLFQLTQSAAAALESLGNVGSWSVHLGVLSGVVHHGNGADVGLEGLDCSRRAMFATEGPRWSAGWDSAATPAGLLDEILAAQPFRRSATRIYSALCD